MSEFERIEVGGGFAACLHYDEMSESPRTARDNVWTFYAAPGVDYILDGLNTPSPDNYWTDGEWIGSVRDHGSDTVALLRSSSYDGTLTRVKSPEQANVLAVVSADKIKEEWGGDRAAAYRYLDGEIAEYNTFARGEVYGFTVEGPGNPTESCWGFYGDDDGYFRREAVEAAEYERDQYRAACLMRGLAQVGSALEVVA